MMSLISKLIAAYSSSTSEEEYCDDFSVTLEVSEPLAVVKFSNFAQTLQLLDITSVSFYIILYLEIIF